MPVWPRAPSPANAYSPSKATLLRVGKLSRVVPQRSAFGQSVDLLCQILGVIADALQRLGGEQDVEILRAGRSVRRGQVPVKQGMAQAVHFRVRLQYALRVRGIAGEEAQMDLLQHFAEQRSHLDQLPRIRGRQFFTTRFQLHDRAISEVANPFQVGNELQAGQQLTRLGFTSTACSRSVAPAPW